MNRTVAVVLVLLAVVALGAAAATLDDTATADSAHLNAPGAVDPGRP